MILRMEGKSRKETHSNRTGIIGDDLDFDKVYNRERSRNSNLAQHCGEGEIEKNKNKNTNQMLHQNRNDDDQE